MLQIGAFGQSLGGIKQLTTTDTGAPDTYIIRVLQFCEVGKETVLVQEVNLLLTCQFLIAGEGDDLHARRQYEESHIETDLVITSTCASVGDGVGTNLFSIAGDGDGLENAFAGYGDGVTVVAQHIAENHVFQRLGIILLCHIEGYILYGPQFISVLFVGLQLFGAESAGIGTGSIDIPAVLG